MERTVLNEWGEPIGTEYVPTQDEEEIAYFEEIDRCASDPYYARMRELEQWQQKARMAFEEQGIRVPFDVEERLAEEMMEKARKLEEDRQLEMAKPVVDFFGKMFPDVHVWAMYYPPTPCEIGQVEIKFDTNGRTITKEEIRKAIHLGYERGIENVEDYILDY